MTKLIDSRQQNVKHILDELRFCEGRTKKELSERTQLSFSTVSNLCNELKSKEVLCDEKVQSTGRGRSPNPVIFLRNKFCSVCFNLQLKGLLEMAILDFGNQVLYQSRSDITFLHSPEEIVQYAHTLFTQMDYPWMAGLVFVGVGVAVAGVQDVQSGQLRGSAIPELENAPLQSLFSEKFKLPCSVEHAANLCAIALRQWAGDTQELLYLHLSEGAGLGVIADGKLLRGKNGYAAAVSHIPVGDHSAVCPVCGHNGCIAAQLSLKTMVEDVQHSPAETTAHLWYRWGQIADEMAADSELYSTFLSQKGGLIGELISILVHLFDPELVFVGGSVAPIFEALLPFIEAELGNRNSLALHKSLRLLCDRESEKSIFIGANQTIYAQWNPLSL